jgi:hypothetical protein
MKSSLSILLLIGGTILGANAPTAHAAENAFLVYRFEDTSKEPAEVLASLDKRISKGKFVIIDPPKQKPSKSFDCIRFKRFDKGRLIYFCNDKKDLYTKITQDFIAEVEKYKLRTLNLKITIGATNKSPFDFPFGCSDQKCSDKTECYLWPSDSDSLPYCYCENYEGDDNYKCQKDPLFPKQ